MNLGIGLSGFGCLALATCITADANAQPPARSPTALRLEYVHHRSTALEKPPAELGIKKIGAAPDTGATESRGSATLTVDSFTCDNENEILHDDFAKRRRIVFNKQRKNYRDDSHFGAVAFREAEIQNRVHVLKVLEIATEGKPDEGKPFHLADCEALLGLLSAPDRKPDLKFVEHEGWTAATVDGKAPASWRGKLVDLPAELQLARALALRYTASIHPAIHPKLLETRSIPKELKFRTRDNFLVVEHRIAFEKHAAADGFVFKLPKDAEPAVDESDKLDVLRNKVRADKAVGKAPKQPDLEADIHAALARGRKFDALLGLIEMSLAFPETRPELTRRVLAEAKDDPRAKEFLAAMSEVKPDNAKAAEAFEKMDRTGLKYGRIIDVEIAVVKMMSNDFTGARKMYLKAVEANPFLAGPYHDLGGIDVNSFKHESAWRNWETMEAIAPRHPMLEPVKRYEKGLGQRRPEFFLVKRGKS